MSFEVVMVIPTLSIAEAWRRAGREKGLILRTCANPEEARRILESGKKMEGIIVYADSTMPVHLSSLRRIRESYPRIPSVLVSPESLGESASGQLDFDAVLIKPVSPSVGLDRLLTLSDRAKQDELAAKNAEETLDPHTGLLTRESFAARAEELRESILRAQGTVTLALCSLEFDQLKAPESSESARAAGLRRQIAGQIEIWMNRRKTPTRRTEAIAFASDRDRITALFPIRTAPAIIERMTELRRLIDQAADKADGDLKPSIIVVTSRVLARIHALVEQAIKGDSPVRNDGKAGTRWIDLDDA